MVVEGKRLGREGRGTCRVASFGGWAPLVCLRLLLLVSVSVISSIVCLDYDSNGQCIARCIGYRATYCLSDRVPAIR